MTARFYEIEDRVEAEAGDLSRVPVTFAPAKPQRVRVSTRKLNREKSLLPAGVPRWVRCYDNGGESHDRFTVCFTGRAGCLRAPGYAPEYQFRAMSTHPTDPQGFGQWGGTKLKPCDVDRWGFPPAMGRKNHLGKRIPFTDLPPDCRKLVLADYREIWGLT